MSVSTETATPVATKRRPGRPRKAEGLTSTVSTLASQEEQVKRRPGRPKGSKNKPKTAEDRAWEAAAPTNARSVEDAPVAKRRPGRPRKQETNAQNTPAQQTQQARRPGRPKGSPNKPKIVEENGQKIIRVEPFTATPEQVIGTVEFMNGFYRGYQIVGTFDMVRPYKQGGNGDGFVTIREPNGKRTRVTVGHNSEGVDYKVTYNERGKALIEEMNRPKKPGRPRDPNTVRRVSMPSTLIPN